MNKEELKKRALSMVQIPDHYQLVIEHYVEEENGEGAAIFSWANEEQEEGINLNLDLAGNLTSLSFVNEDRDTINQDAISIEEKKEKAEQFLLSHYPNALIDFTLYKTIKLSQGDRFYFGQMVMGLPLTNAGCLIDINLKGEVVGFIYNGLKPIPEIPAKMIAKEKVIEDLRGKLDFQLCIHKVYSDLHNVVRDGYRLVYEPFPSCMEYKADVLEPTLAIVHEEEDLPIPHIPLPFPSVAIERNDFSVEEVVGITDGMEVIREVDMGEELGIVWREKDWVGKEKDLSVNGLFKSQMEDTVKAFVSKKTGRVRSIMWFLDQDGTLQLSREECNQMAIDFLQRHIPEFIPYVEQIVLEYEEEDDSARIQSFIFDMHNGHGIPIELELITVGVNPKTGQIDHYSGPDFDIEEVSKIPGKPSISKREVHEIFMNHLDFELAWTYNLDSKGDPDILVHQPVEWHSRTAIRYIDAVTGEVITAKDY